MPIYSFEPIVDKNCKVLVLGTMPGAMSLKKQQYYGYDQNALWRIMYGLFGRQPDGEYELRKAFLLEHHIALWDVLMACEREGSSDSDIKEPVQNDFAALYENYPNLGVVCFNGGPAERLYRRFVEKPGDLRYGPKAYFSMPSTSPAYTIGFEKKFEQWKLLLQLLRQ
jgi:TDG/mug DNA glycosylase family protein